jgi:hypothetical protein
MDICDLLRTLDMGASSHSTTVNNSSPLPGKVPIREGRDGPGTSGSLL